MKKISNEEALIALAEGKTVIGIDTANLKHSYKIEDGKFGYCFENDGFNFDTDLTLNNMFEDPLYLDVPSFEVYVYLNKSTGLWHNDIVHIETDKTYLSLLTGQDQDPKKFLKLFESLTEEQLELISWKNI